MIVLDLPGDWVKEALCAQVDAEIFYPEKGGSVREAKQTCFRCAVRPECLQYALSTEQWFGVWGGTSERERRRLLSGETPVPTHAELIADRNRRIHAGWLAGATPEELATEYAINVSTIRGVLSQPPTPTHEPVEVDVTPMAERIRALAATGLDSKQVAERLGVTPRRVSVEMYRADIEARLADGRTAHGTLLAVQAGCDCDECSPVRDARNARRRAERAKRGEAA